LFFAKTWRKFNCFEFIFKAGGKKSKKEGKKKDQKSTSNAFSMFDQNQIQEFKEVRLLFCDYDIEFDGAIKKEYNIRFREL